MTVEKLQARKEELKKQYDSTIANANALMGAMQDVDWLIAELAKEAVAVVVPAEVVPAKAEVPNNS